MRPVDHAKSCQWAQKMSLSQSREAFRLQGQGQAHTEERQAINEENQDQELVDRLTWHIFSSLGILHQYPPDGFAKHHLELRTFVILICPISHLSLISAGYINPICGYIPQPRLGISQKAGGGLNLRFF
jgi:hypothetical protein